MRTRRPAVRPLTSDDGGVDAVIAGLSVRSRYLRFHTPVPRLTGSMRAALLDVDGRDRVALVAEVRRPGSRAGHPVGIARLYRTGPAEAEPAVAVVDARQGRGIGRQLLTELGARARDLGYDRLFRGPMAGGRGPSASSGASSRTISFSISPVAVSARPATSAHSVVCFARDRAAAGRCAQRGTCASPGDAQATTS